MENLRTVTCENSKDMWLEFLGGRGGGALFSQMDLQVKCALNVSFCEATTGNWQRLNWVQEGDPKRLKQKQFYGRLIGRLPGLRLYGAILRSA